METIKIIAEKLKVTVVELFELIAVVFWLLALGLVAIPIGVFILFVAMAEIARNAFEDWSTNRNKDK